MREYANINNIEIGDHVTEVIYTDARSFTVIRKTARMIECQMDFQEIDKENWQPEIIPGGFAGHCTNQWSQKWIVKSNPNGGKCKFYANKDGIFQSSIQKKILKGSYPFYDYNF